MHLAIIIPVYNVTQFLDSAIRSAALQACPDLVYEIIVVDDGSTPEHAPNIASICNRYPLVSLYHQSHQGAAAARDFGRSQTGAELIVFLDADDILLPGALSYFTKAMRREPDAIAVYARVRNIDILDEAISGLLPVESWITSGPTMLEFLLERKVPFCNGSVCIQANALKKLQVDNHHLTVGEDWVLWCHLALLGKIIYAGDQVVLHRRKHPHSTSAKSLENPDLPMASLRTIFAHPAFKSVMGEEKLAILQEKAQCRIHASLASAYATTGHREQAMLHLQHITLPLSEVINRS